MENKNLGQCGFGYSDWSKMDKTKSNTNIYAAVRATLRATYIDKIGYDPIEDDPTISNEKMESILQEWEMEQ